MNRRTLLRTISAGILFATLPSGWFPGNFRATRRALEAMRHVGFLYLEEAPEEADAGRLKQLTGIRTPITDPSWVLRFRDQKRAEFSAGDTVLIDGWILARCEARLCALAALA